MESETLRVAVVQMTSVDSISENRKFIREILSTLPANEVDLICFPENALYLRIQEGESIPAFTLEDECFQEFSQLARQLGVHLHFGSVPLQINGDLFNSSVWVSDQGRVKAGYQKIHLFDIELEGKKPIRESDVFSRGLQLHTQEIKGWKLGESICYDLRFSELYRVYADRGVDVVLVPAAFLVETGRAHWEVLLRARAIENQVYVIASAQGGQHSSVKSEAFRETFGHSLFVNPWGDIEGDQKNQKGLAIYTLERKKITKVRTQIPMKDHRQQRKAQIC